MSERPPATIAVVDDTDATRYAVTRILRRAGYEVREAATGADACAWRPKGPTCSSSTSTCPT